MKQYRMGVVKEVRRYYSISCLCGKDVISTGRINLDYLRAEDERNRQLVNMGDGSRRINGLMGVMSKLKWNSES